MVAALGKQCDRHWDQLPAENQYGWRSLIRHLRGAGQETDADCLLTDYRWIKAKLHAVGAHELFESYRPESLDEGVRLVGRAIALSLPALASARRQLPQQLFGRVGNTTHPAVAAIAASARQDLDFSPTPRWPGLTPPGAERLRFIGHESRVSSACVSAEASRILTASWDRMARLWDSNTGDEIRALRGHEGRVVSACFSADVEEDGFELAVPPRTE